MEQITLWDVDGTFRHVSIDQRCSSNIATRQSVFFEDMLIYPDEDGGISLVSQCVYRNEPGELPGTPMKSASDDDYFVFRLVTPELSEHIDRVDCGARPMFVKWEGDYVDLRCVWKTASLAYAGSVLSEAVCAAANVLYAEARNAWAIPANNYDGLLELEGAFARRLGVPHDWLHATLQAYTALQEGQGDDKRGKCLIVLAMKAASEARAPKGEGQERRSDEGSKA